jgi:hypothetical protein
MDGADNGPATESQFPHSFDDGHGSEGVETSSRLVKENEHWVRDQLHSNGSTLTLSSRHSLYHVTSNLCVLALLQSQLSDDIGDSLKFFGERAGKFEFGSEFEAFSDTHGLEEDVVLLHVGRNG